MNSDCKYTQKYVLILYCTKTAQITGEIVEKRLLANQKTALNRPF